MQPVFTLQGWQQAYDHVPGVPVTAFFLPGSPGSSPEDAFLDAPGKEQPELFQRAASGE
jgi:hypothetical protein